MIFASAAAGSFQRVLTEIAEEEDILTWILLREVISLAQARIGALTIA